MDGASTVLSHDGLMPGCWAQGDEDLASAGVSAG